LDKKIIYKKVKTPTILQMEAVECGAASLAMILAYHKKFVPLEKLREECGVTRDGVNALNMVKAARKMGMEAKGFRKEPEDLKNMKPPMIIHWNFNHFVVFEGIKNNKAYINDPGSGRRTVSLEEFDLAFTGVTLTFKPNEDFEKGGKKPTIKEGLLNRLKGSRTALIYLILVGLLMVIPGIIIPSFSKIFIDEILLAGKKTWLSPLLWCMGITAIIQGGLTALQQYYLLRMETKIALTGASKFFWHILRLPVVFFQQRSAGDISIRMGSNDKVAAFLSQSIAENAISIITVGFYFIVMIQYSVLLTFATLGLAMVSVIYFIYSSSKIENLNSKSLQEVGKVYGIAISGLYIIETLKATGCESGFFSKWAGHHTKQINCEQTLGKTSQTLFTLPNFMSGLAEVIVLCLGGIEIMNGNLTVGSLIAFQGLLGNFMEPINKLTQMGMSIKELKGDMNRLDDVMKYQVDKNSDPDKDALNSEDMKESDFRKLDGYVEIKNLSFGYNLLEPPLIEDFNLKITPGSRIALVGSSGSGKSTIAKILAGIYSPWSGEILLDGCNKDDISRNIINNSIAIVDQDISMFNASIMENLTMWDSTIPESDVIKAAKDACIQDDIMKRKGGYSHQVDEGGFNFSGGQRQRIEIARALSINPSIMIMDEATSALDSTTEQIVDQNIRCRGCTCIIVAHRLSTIRDCDEIIVLNRGKIVQRGTHDEMKLIEGPYSKLISSAV